SVSEKQQAAEAVILPYAIIAGIVLLVAILFFIMRIPEPDKGQGLKFSTAIFRKKHLMNAVIAQLFYVGAQVGIWGITINYVTELWPGTSNETASYYMIIRTFLFISSRFIVAGLMNSIQVHRLLTFFAAVAVFLCLVCTIASGSIDVYSALGVNFFMSIMFPTIFALCIKDLGDDAKLGS